MCSPKFIEQVNATFAKTIDLSDTRRAFGNCQQECRIKAWIWAREVILDARAFHSSSVRTGVSFVRRDGLSWKCLAATAMIDQKSRRDVL